MTARELDFLASKNMDGFFNRQQIKSKNMLGYKFTKIVLIVTVIVLYLPCALRRFISRYCTEFQEFTWYVAKATFLIGVVTVSGINDRWFKFKHLIKTIKQNVYKKDKSNKIMSLTKPLICSFTQI